MALLAPAGGPVHGALGYPAQAKLGLGAIVLVGVGVGVLAFGWFVFRRVRRRRTSQVPG